jgi:hypothetical protein
MTWTPDELTRIGAADELEIASTRDDGTVRPYVTIWAVRVDDGIYIRSAHGPENGWYRRALASGTGRIRAGGVERAVTFEAADDHAAIDAEYHAKYDRYGARIVGSVVSAQSHAATFRVVPA